jgi:hypothetical protein
LLGGDFFGSQFNDIQGGATEVAVAEIFPVLQGPRQSDITTPTGRATDTQRSDAAEQGFQATGDDANTRAQRNARSGLGTTRIGIAGFRDSDNGLLVMLDVGGLAPGNYLVGIGDAGMIATPGSVGAGTSFAPAGTPATTPQRVQNRTARPLPPDQDIPTSAPAPADGQPTNRVTPPASRERAPGRAQPQGSNQQQQIPRTVLAQVVEGVEADPSAAGATNGASAGQAQPVTPGGPEQPLIPNTGQVDPLDTPPIGQARTSQDTQRDGALGDRTGQDTGLETGDAGIGSASIGTGTGLGPTVNVGTLTVDQSGTGRLQQVVEGVQVQQVVGQAIVILSDQVSPNTALPANLNAAGAATPDQAAAAQRNAADQTRPGDLRRGTARPPTASNQTVPPTAVGGQGVGNPMPVAAGIIRLMSDRRPNDGLDAGQPAASLPTTGQDLR